MSEDKNQKKKPEREHKFKIGNQYWKNAINPGRKKNHETPIELLEAAYEYFTWAETTPIMESVVSAGKVIKIPKRRPFTLYGLCIHMGVNSRYITDIEDRCIGKTDPTIEDYDQSCYEFSQVVTHIREVIYNQKYEGAAVGHFKEGLIARDLGIHENINNKLYSGNDEPLKSQIHIFQIPDNNRPVTNITNDEQPEGGN